MTTQFKWYRLFLTLPIILAACSAPTPVPTATPIPPTATITPTFTASPIPATPTASATFTPVPPTATNTATPNHLATATRQSIVDTATALAQAPLVLDDSFDVAAHGWATGNQSSSYAKLKLQISGGKYHWDMTDIKPITWVQFATTYIPPDFTYSVDAQQLKDAPVSSFGLLVRGASNYDSYYFAFRNTGEFAVVKFKKNQGNYLRNWTGTRAFKPDQVNHLAVTATGSTFRIFINDQYMATVEDSDFTKGSVGLAVEATHPKDEAIVEFDNVQVRAEKPVSTGGGGTVATQPPAVATQPASAATTGRLVVVECSDIESTITFFFGGQIIKQESLHGKGINNYDLAPGHYNVQFNAQGYYNINTEYDIVAGRQITQYIDGPC